MQLCDDGHEEICYEGSSCPCCDTLSRISDLIDEIDGCNSTISDLRSELRDLQQEFDSLVNE